MDDLPPNVSAFIPLAFASFVPSTAPSTSQQQREPGLLTVGILGDIRFWESISMALTGVDRFKAVNMGLNDGELVRGLEMLSPSSYIAFTSHSRLVNVSVSSVGGRATLSVRVLERSSGWASSVWTSVFGGRAPDPQAGIRALALSPVNSAGAGRSFAYALSDKNVQVWDLPTRGDGGERLVAECDVFLAVLEGLNGEQLSNEDWAINSGNVEILHAAVVPS